MAEKSFLVETVTDITCFAMKGATSTLQCAGTLLTKLGASLDEAIDERMGRSEEGSGKQKKKMDCPEAAGNAAPEI